MPKVQITMSYRDAVTLRRLMGASITVPNALHFSSYFGPEFAREVEDLMDRMYEMLNEGGIPPYVPAA